VIVISRVDQDVKAMARYMHYEGTICTAEVSISNQEGVQYVAFGGLGRALMQLHLLHIWASWSSSFSHASEQDINARKARTILFEARGDEVQESKVKQ
jgi:hypothetical protein